MGFKINLRVYRVKECFSLWNRTLCVALLSEDNQRCGGEMKQRYCLTDKQIQYRKKRHAENEKDKQKEKE